MTDLTQTIADAAEKYADDLIPRMKGRPDVKLDIRRDRWVNFSAFTAGANLIVGMLEIAETNLADLRSSYSAAVTRYYELDAKLKIATTAIETMLKEDNGGDLSWQEIARKALGAITSAT